MNKRPILISVEGNIGAGKSTILEHMETYFTKNCQELSGKILFLKEPLDIWEQFKDENGLTILEKFYKSQKRYAFTFQVMAYITRLSLLKNAIKQNPEVQVIIIERSLCADKNIFMNMLHDDGVVENIEFSIYNKWYSEFIQDYRVDAVIYMDSNPETCAERINRRNRSGEEGIPVDYLKKCKDYHSKWLLDTKCSDIQNMSEYISMHTIHHEGYAYPVLRIDSNKDTDYNSDDGIGKCWLNAIRTFILETGTLSFTLC
jgi:deoxycitidine kinase/deoxyguanosine kinase